MRLSWVHDRMGILRLALFRSQNVCGGGEQIKAATQVTFSILRESTVCIASVWDNWDFWDFGNLTTAPCRKSLSFL